MQTILLVDNGSRRPDATLRLRALATELSEISGQVVHPVSLQHADKINPDKLEGKPAEVFTDFMDKHLQQGERDFIVLPLFFGLSRALTSFIPQQQALLEEKHGCFNLVQAETLYPMPDGDDQLVDILFDHYSRLRTTDLECVVMVDHGSPIPEVTAVRRHIVDRLQQKLDDTLVIEQAVMERREGAEYDFNGDLLEDWLEQQAGQGVQSILLLMLFLLPGRHAGEGGDIATICADAMSQHPDMNITISPLVADHSGVVELLKSRLEAVTT